MNHFTVACKTKINSIQTVNEEEKEYFLGKLTETNHNNKNLNICKTVVRFKIETGANINIISTQTYKNLREKSFPKPVNLIFTNPEGIVQCIGKSTIAT